VRTLAIAVALMCSVAPIVAHAETAANLAAHGEQLAKEGRLTEAIEAFKKADRIEPRARHACLIALAYIRRELWPQAEVFLTTCHDRASDDDPLPDWVPLADKQLVERLAQAQVAAVAIRVLPEQVAQHAEVAVSSFAPDERFHPRTIHLAPGKHLITVTAPGRTAIQQTIELADTTPHEVVIDFDAKPEPPPIDTPRPVIVEHPPRTVAWTLLAIGGAGALAGVSYHVLAFKPTRDRLAAASDDPDPALYNQYSKEFDRRRAVTLALYGASAAVLITGVVLRYTVYADREASPEKRERHVRASAQVAPGSVLLGLEWRR
jgi:hypothetical protein